MQSVVELNQSYSESSDSCWQGLYSIAVAVQIAAARPLEGDFCFPRKGVIISGVVVEKRKTVEKVTDVK